MKQLRFHLTKLPHPDPNGIGARAEAWGRLTCTYKDRQTETLFDTEWNMDELAEWFAGHSARLCQIALPDEPQPGESLAQAYDRLMQQDFDDEEAAQAWFDQLYDFRALHYLRMWLRGARIAPILIGCNNGAGEISFYLDETIPEADYKRLIAPTRHMKPGNWSYTFDMPDFLTHLRGELERFLHEWHETTPHDDGKRRAQMLLDWLRLR